MRWSEAALLWCYPHGLPFTWRMPHFGIIRWAKCMRENWIARIGVVAVLCAAPALAQSPPNVIHLDFTADVQADGVPTNIQPDASLAAPLQAMVRKRVVDWRYKVGVWQGTPVPATVSQRIVAEVLPVTSGGFALRIKEITYPTVTLDRNGVYKGINRAPPVYPKELMRRAVGGVLVYSYRVDATGKAEDIQLVHPEKPSRDVKLLDAASRAAIAQWTFQPTMVGKERVDCRSLTPLTFNIGDTPMPNPDVSAYRERTPDVCPAGPKLLTQVEGSLL